MYASLFVQKATFAQKHSQSNTTKYNYFTTFVKKFSRFSLQFPKQSKNKQTNKTTAKNNKPTPKKRILDFIKEKTSLTLMVSTEARNAVSHVSAHTDVPLP